MDPELRAEFTEIRSRFDKVDERLDKVDGRFDKIDGRLDKVDGRLDKHGELLEEMRGHLKIVAEGVAGTNERLDREFAKLWVKLDERIQPIEVATKRLYGQRQKD